MPCWTLTDRAVALAMFDRRRDGLSQVQNVLVDGGYRKALCHCGARPVGSPVEVVKRNERAHLRGASKAMGGGAVLRLAGKVPPLWKNCGQEAQHTSLQMVVLAFTVLILKRLVNRLRTMQNLEKV